MHAFWLAVGFILVGFGGGGVGLFGSKFRAEIHRMSRQMIKKYDEYSAHKTGKPIRKRRWRN